MTDALLNTLLDYGALGLFAAFMVWQHLSMTKRQHEEQKASSERSDVMQTRFEEKLSELAAKYEAREESLRERYDNVVREYQERNEDVRESVLTRLSELHQMMETGLGEMRAHYQEAKMKEQNPREFRSDSDGLKVHSWTHSRHSSSDAIWFVSQCRILLGRILRIDNENIFSLSH